jgi:hypothetical protein
MKPLGSVPIPDGEYSGQKNAKLCPFLGLINLIIDSQTLNRFSAIFLLPMAVSFKLSPMSSYYLRRLVQAQKGLLLQCDNPELKTAIEHSDPEGMLGRLGLSDGEIAQKVNELEVLTRAHQSLSNEGRYPEEMRKLELQIFGVLGWSPNPENVNTADAIAPQAAVTGNEAVRILQDLLKISAGYLGKISGDYLKGTCPVAEWGNQLTIQKGNILELTCFNPQELDPSELENLRTWVIQYIKRCSTIIGGFHEIANNDDFKALSIEVSDLESP